MEEAPEAVDPANDRRRRCADDSIDPTVEWDISLENASKRHKVANGVRRALIDLLIAPLRPLES